MVAPLLTMTPARTIRLMAALALGLVATLAPGDASACSCAPDTGLQPTSSSPHVPSNTLVWVKSPSCSPSLRTADGAEVPVSTSTLQLGGSSVFVLRPAAPLTIGASYRVEGCALSGDRTFTVTEGPDTTPPAAPSFALRENYLSADDDSCGKESYVTLAVTSEGPLLVLDVEGRTQLDPARLQGSVVDFFEDPARAYVGKSDCRSNWSFDDDSEASDVRLGAFDLAGNFSGWSAPQDVHDPSRCGCTMVRPTMSDRGYLALVGLGLALAGGRRARRPAQRTA